MSVNPILKRVMKPVKEDIFHSSAYGAAQSGAGMGSASTESFSRRRKIEENRRLVKGYNHSSIASAATSNGPRAKVFTPPPKNPGVS